MVMAAVPEAFMLPPTISTPRSRAALDVLCAPVPVMAIWPAVVLAFDTATRVSCTPTLPPPGMFKPTTASLLEATPVICRLPLPEVLTPESMITMPELPSAAA
jgi:hypothetical protein